MFFVITNIPKNKKAALFDSRCIDNTEFKTKYRGIDTQDRLYYGYTSKVKAMKAREFIKKCNSHVKHGLRLYIKTLSIQP